MKRFLILLLLFAIGFFSLVSAHDVFAVDDISVTLSASNTRQFIFCDSNDSCSGYKYLIMNTNFVINDNVRVSLSDGTNTYYLYLNPTVSDYSVLALPDSLIANLSYFRYSSNSQTNAFLTGDHTITLTLSSTPPDSEPCPDCPTCPPETDPNRSSIMQDFHDVFMNTFVSIIYVCPVIFIVWFFIDIITSLVFGRGR